MQCPYQLPDLTVELQRPIIGDVAMMVRVGTVHSGDQAPLREDSATFNPTNVCPSLDADARRDPTGETELHQYCDTRQELSLRMDAKTVYLVL